MPNLSIEEKKSTYIRDFTYYVPSELKSTGNELDINKVLEVNLEKMARKSQDPEDTFECILEVPEDNEASRVISSQNGTT